MRVVGCFLEYDGKIVLLLRHTHKPNGNTWGLAAGKVDEGESDMAAVLRELREETGYSADVSEVEYLREDEYQFDDDPPFVFIAYRVRLEKPHEIIVEIDAHQEYRWVTPAEGYGLDLVPGLKKVFELTGYVPDLVK